MLALAVAQGDVRVFVGTGSAPPLPIVTLEIEPDGCKSVKVEMTPGQTRRLIAALEAMLDLESESKPEGT
jgi:hypothetical protein